ncbi:MAG: GIY-YIG nuclease family protein [Fimbriimonadaceae bacterium]
MFVVYILYSKSKNRFYIGHTADLQDRINRHNQARSKATMQGIPWELVYTEEHPTKSRAQTREFEIKSWKS